MALIYTCGELVSAPQLNDCRKILKWNRLDVIICLGLVFASYTWIFVDKKKVFQNKCFLYPYSLYLLRQR